MQVLIAQLNPTIGDLAGNSKKIIAAIGRAKEKKADLILFSELALSGYPPDDLLLLPHFIEAIEKKLQEIIPATRGITAIIGLPRKNPHTAEKPLYNSAAILSNGALVGFQDKTHLPTYDVFDERRYFEPARENRVWKLCGKKIAITICEDIWQQLPLPPPADLLINLSASPFCTGKFSERLQISQKAVKSLDCPLLFCNQVGGNDSLIFDGQSFYMDASGALLAVAPSFVEADLLVDLSEKRKPVRYQSDPMEELYQALILGIRDYFHKQGFSRACFGLSGGIDSAVVATLAKEALGSDNLLALMMPSRYSSKSTKTDATALLKRLAIPSKTLSIEGPFTSYLELLAPHFAGMEEDTAEENLQARIRGMLLMAFSNKFGYLVLATGNKSELALGYATLYGDMCGGLGVISDLTKEQVFALARWINRGEEVIPSHILEKAPSAELRPGQKDSDTLPPYAIIDTVLREYVEKHTPPNLIAKRFGYSKELVHSLIRRIHRNEYKRRQSAPGLRVSQKAFSAGRRFPIVQRWV